MVGYTRKRKETLIIMLQAKFYIYIHVINTCIAKFFYILFIVYVSVNLYFLLQLIFNCFPLFFVMGMFANEFEMVPSVQCNQLIKQQLL